jgi:uncharacterized transporter YbjL
MRKDKFVSLLLFVVFSAVGIYLLHDSLYDAGRYAESTVFAGALFSALALAALSWSLRQHFMHKALRRHLRRHHS